MKNKSIIKLSIVTMSFVQMGTNGIAPILSSIAAAFPDSSPTKVQFLMTFPSIFMLLFTMACAFLSDHMPKKVLSVSGLGTISIAGLGACLMHGSINLLFVWAAVLGIGMGMVAPIAPSLVNELFTGSERQTMLGWQNSSTSIGSMIMTFLGGFLAIHGWQYGYLVYLIAIPGIVFTLIALPGKHQKAKTACTFSDRPPFKLLIWKEMLITLVLLMGYSAAPANISMLVIERGFTNTSIAGIVSTLFLLSGTICGLFFGKIVNILGRFTSSVGAAMLIIGSFLIASFGSLPLITLGCILAGTSISLIMPSCMGAANRLKGYETLNSALLLSCSFVGVFITPLLTSLTQMITHSSATYLRFYMVSIVGLVLLVMTILLNKTKKGAN